MRFCSAFNPWRQASSPAGKPPSLTYHLRISAAVVRVGGCHPPRQASTPATAGSILLEVILALALFVTAAAIVTSGMNASADSLERQRLNTHAGNLAATVLAEIQLGIRSTAAGGEQPFLAPFDKWTAELVVSPPQPSRPRGPQPQRPARRVLTHAPATPTHWSTDDHVRGHCGRRRPRSKRPPVRPGHAA